jgi:hypothetical protein
LTLIGEWLERDHDEYDARFRGWVFKNPQTGAGVAYDDKLLAAAGSLVIRVAGVTYRLDALQHSTFRPGQPLELDPQPTNPHDRNAVAIWDAGRRHHVGFVPKETAPAVAARLRNGERLRAMCLAEFVGRTGERSGIRVLIAPETFRLELDEGSRGRGRRRHPRRT